MRFCRFAPHPAGAPAFGIVDGDTITEISGAPWSAWERSARSFAARECRFLAPVRPGKIVCVGRNYAAHAAELGNDLPTEPLIFLKPPSAIVGPDQPVVLPRYSERVEHEGELALVVGKRSAHLGDSEDALSHLLGYTCVNDVTARDIQKRETQFTRAKGFDTFCPVGPWIETGLDPADVTVEARVNGQLRQSGSTRLMIFPVAFLVRWISRMMTLEPGDLIATGTPAGVGPLAAGDLVEISVSGVGVLRNPVQAA